MFLLLAFSLILLIQLYFYLIVFRTYSNYKSSQKEPVQNGVSIVIAARNEEKNLSTLLAHVAKQDYPLFELILVDDGSSDETLTDMKTFQNLHAKKGFKTEVISILSKDSKGKKQAITRGIDAASFDHILLTDADCLPESNQWIQRMAQSFTPNVDIVLGYGAYVKREKSFLNKLIRFETLLTALQYFSFALRGNPYMGVGRNLAYTKSTFLSNDGFSAHEQIKSGDDDLFISQASTRHNVVICDDPDSFTVSEAHVKTSNWIRQKRRHITTATHYKAKIKASLAIFYISQFLFYALGLFGLITNTYIAFLIPLLLLRFVIWYSTISKAASKLKEKDLTAFGPLYEISIIFIQLYIFIKNKISPPKYW